MVLVVFSINRFLCCSAYLQAILCRFSSVRAMTIDLLYADKTQKQRAFFLVSGFFGYFSVRKRR